ncbi:MAG: Rossmann-like domain-containing protein [Promethearchaeota archaeon]
MILEKTIEVIKQIYKIHRIIPPKINRVVIGIRYTGVELSTFGYGMILGVAYTLPEIIKKTDCNKIKFVGSLTKKNIFELMEWSFGPLNLGKIIGIATLNAVSQHILQIMNPYKKVKDDLFDILKIEKNSKVIFIGLIRPIIEKMRKTTDSIVIIEDTQQPPEEFNYIEYRKNINQLRDYDLETDVLICTGTTLINNTLENILKLFKNKARTIAIIGPSVSMIPDVLFDYGIDIVGGMTFKDSDTVIRIIQEGGGTKNFKHYGKKYNLIKE